MELVRLSRKRATDEVYDSMRQAILTRVFKPGERLQVEEISAKLGVSLTPVRHALQRLATEGLIEIHPRSGTYVASVSAKDIEETFEIRCALELLAGEKAIERITPDQVRRLNDLLGILARPVEGSDALAAHEKANAEFHQILIQASSNQRLIEMYESLNAHIKIARIHSAETNRRPSWADRLKEEQDEHEAIVQGLVTRDLPALTAALRKHITRAKDALVTSLKETE
jgi:DNA-binding GntR family transcriptional regulator